MKKILPLLFLVFAFNAKSQTIPNTYQDTVNYLNNEIVAKKNLYIGKPFSVLLDSLKINPVRFSLTWATADSLKGKSALLHFNYADAFKQKHFLIVEWLNPIPFSTYNPIAQQSYPEFTPALRSMYAPIIIKEIDVKDYNQNDIEEDELIE